MKVVGFHSAHDCAFCVLEDGVPAIHAELERYTREKEPPGDGLEFFYEKYPDAKDVKHFVHCLDTHKGGVKSRYPDSFKKMEKQISEIGGQFHVVGHHLAHAAHAFYSSNFEDAVILTIDGGGPEIFDDGDAAATTLGVFLGNKNKVSRIQIAPYHQIDIGGFWTHCTREIFGLSGGYPKGHQAGTIMAMAALGNPERWEGYFLKSGMRPDTFVHKSERDAFYDAVKESSDNSWWGTVPPTRINKMKNVINQSIDFRMLKEIAQRSEQDSFDIAAGIQSATEQIVKSIIDDISKHNISKNLCLSGGVALNSVLVGKIKTWFRDSFSSIYVPPVPYDAGLAIGAAQFVWHDTLGNERVLWKDNASPYLGEIYDNKRILSAISKFDAVKAVNVTDDEVIDHLLSSKIVSVFRAGSESGRRALGNRSIVADPRSNQMKDLINEKVKHRQWFRPFAPSILREDVSEWFEEDVDSPYMSFVIKFKNHAIDRVPAVVHFDKTARLQTVTKLDNPWYHQFLTKWKNKSGVPILLNTSFNDREPIVESPEDAIKCFLGTDIDYLYFVDAKLLVSKS